MSIDLARFRSWVGLALSVVLGTAVLESAAIAQSEGMKFELTNDTGTTISQFYASPHGVKPSEQNILGKPSLNKGETLLITISESSPDCKYDFKVVYEDGSQVKYEDISVCNGESWTVK